MLIVELLTFSSLRLTQMKFHVLSNTRERSYESFNRPLKRAALCKIIYTMKSN